MPGFPIQLQPGARPEGDKGEEAAGTVERQGKELSSPSVGESSIAIYLRQDARGTPGISNTPLRQHSGGIRVSD